jgi:hypothetical protein
MTDLQETLHLVAGAFVARDIMVSLERLCRADDEATATQKLEQNPQFDIIPMPEKGRLVAFLEREANNAPSKVITIGIQHVVSAETTVPDLLDSFCDRRHVFVVGRHEVIGMIHFSDLNDPVLKLPFFVLLEGVERRLADGIRDLVTEEALTELIHDKEHLNALRAKWAELKPGKANRDWVTLLNFRDVLEAAVWFKTVSLSTTEIEDLSAVRNLVAHAVKRQLVEKIPADVQRLRRVWEICTRLLFQGHPA